MDQEFQTLFHSLNNQLGIILGHVELIESRAVNDIERGRAGQVIASIFDAMGTVRAIRQHAELVEIPAARVPTPANAVL